MNKGNPTGYTAVPSTACPPTVDTEDYQPAAPSYPQFPSAQPPPAYHDDPASKLFVQFTLKAVQRISFFVIGYSSATLVSRGQTLFRAGRSISDNALSVREYGHARLRLPGV